MSGGVAERAARGVGVRGSGFGHCHNDRTGNSKNALRSLRCEAAAAGLVCIRFPVSGGRLRGEDARPRESAVYAYGPGDG